jgi:ATP-binding cassette subfamily B protein
VVRHGPGAAKFAGRILVFEKGRVAEEGNHGDLMARRGTYYTMYTARGEMYKE